MADRRECGDCGTADLDRCERQGGAGLRLIRRLWGNGSGNFRTKGRYASATIRRTQWLTDDRCNGTLVKVAIGSVTVRDLVTRKSLVVRRRGSYFANA